jgi:hypothetical protein
MVNLREEDLHLLQHILEAIIILDPHVFLQGLLLRLYFSFSCLREVSSYSAASLSIARVARRSSLALRSS